MCEESIHYLPSGITVENEALLVPGLITGFAFDWDETIASDMLGGTNYRQGVDHEMISLMIELKQIGYPVIILSQKPPESVYQAMEQIERTDMISLFPVHSTHSPEDQETVGKFFNDPWFTEKFSKGFKYPTPFGCNVLIDDHMYYYNNEPQIHVFAIIRKGQIAYTWGLQVRQALIEFGILKP